MNATPYEPMKKQALEPHVDLRTIPSGWDLSGFYAPGANWVNDPQHSFEAPQHPNRGTQPSDDETADAV
jgi:hypothetical protein